MCEEVRACICMKKVDKQKYGHFEGVCIECLLTVLTILLK